MTKSPSLTSSAGSLPRPPAVLRHLTDHPDTDIPSSVLKEAVRETVNRQVEVGVTLVGDGETSLCHSRTCGKVLSTLREVRLLFFHGEQLEKDCHE